MPTVTSITRTYKFCAAHRLHTDELPDDVNQKIFGKCNNLNGHGHNYIVQVTVGGELDTKTGLIADVAKLDQIVQETIVVRFDHQHLNFDQIGRAHSEPTTFPTTYTEELAFKI